jgi:aryl-alcohol dehydrogenase-like predicted oxidoreductase
MLTRRYKNTDISLSVVGFGGIIVMNEDAGTAARVVAQAVERGINYFDVAPAYGNAEEMLGPALKPYRKDVFLACKTGRREAKGAEEELNRSLQRLGTDHFDLYQFHAVSRMEDVEKLFAPGGGMETALKAREKGLVRYLGFSSHSDEAAIAMLERFDFDSVLFPINWSAWLKDGLGTRLLPAARKKGVAVLALKSLAKREWREKEERRWSKTWYAPVESFEEASLALRFTLSNPVTAAVSPGHEELLFWACDAADRFTPISEAETAVLADKARELDPIFTTAPR